MRSSEGERKGYILMEGGDERMRGGGKMYSTSTPMPTHQLSDSNRRKMGSHNDDTARNLRVYQAWKGNNIFCLWGRLVFGPDVRSLFLKIFLIIIPVILFCAFVSQRLTDDFHHHLGDYVVLICIVLTAFVSHSSFTDEDLLRSLP